MHLFFFFFFSFVWTTWSIYLCLCGTHRSMSFWSWWPGLFWDSVINIHIYFQYKFVRFFSFKCSHYFIDCSHHPQYTKYTIFVHSPVCKECSNQHLISCESFGSSVLVVNRTLLNAFIIIIIIIIIIIWFNFLCSCGETVENNIVRIFFVWY